MIKYNDTRFLLRTLNFAAIKHTGQFRSGSNKRPYINHPIEVAEMLSKFGCVDAEVLAAALLHDTVEDTTATFGEVEFLFGSRVRKLVEECSDDKGLPKMERKLLQVAHAASLSKEAQQIKIADKTSNVFELPEAGWDLDRKVAYLDWAESVVNEMRGCNAVLEQEFYRALASARGKLLSNV